MPAKTLPRIFSQLETVTESFSKLSSDMLILNANLFSKTQTTTKQSVRSNSKSQRISPALESLQNLLQYMQHCASNPPTFQDTQYLRLLKKAADAGSVFAKYNLAVCLVQLGELDVAVALFGAVMSRAEPGSRMYEDAKFNLRVAYIPRGSLLTDTGMKVGMKRAWEGLSPERSRALSNSEDDSALHPDAMPASETLIQGNTGKLGMKRVTTTTVVTTTTTTTSRTSASGLVRTVQVRRRVTRAIALKDEQDPQDQPCCSAAESPPQLRIDSIPAIEEPITQDREPAAANATLDLPNEPIRITSPFLQAASFQFNFTSPVLHAESMFVQRRSKSIADLPLLITERILGFIDPDKLLNGNLMRFAFTMPFNFRFWIFNQSFARKHVALHQHRYVRRFPLGTDLTPTSKTAEWRDLPSAYKVAVSMYYALPYSWTLGADDPEMGTRLLTDEHQIYTHAFCLGCHHGRSSLVKEVLNGDDRIGDYFYKKGILLAATSNSIAVVRSILEFHARISADQRVANGNQFPEGAFVVTLANSVMDISCDKDFYGICEVVYDVLPELVHTAAFKKHMILSAEKDSSGVLAHLLHLGKPFPEALIAASKHGATSTTQLLLTHDVEVSFGNQNAVRTAAKNNSAATLSILLADPRVDPSVGDSDAIRSAAMCGFYKVVNILLEEERILEADKDIAALHLVLAYALPAPDPSPSSRLPTLMEEIVTSSAATRVLELSQERVRHALKHLIKDARFSRRAVPTCVAMDLAQIFNILLEIPKCVKESSVQYAMLMAVEHNNPVFFNALLKQTKIDPSFESNRVLLHACSINTEKLAERLLENPRTSPADQDPMALRKLMEERNASIVQMLLQDGRCDPGARDHKALFECINGRNARAFELLLKDESDRVHPSKHVESLYVRIIQFNTPEILEALLKDGRACPTTAHLAKAVANRTSIIVKLLLEDKRAIPNATMLEKAIDLKEYGIAEWLKKDGRVDPDDSHIGDIIYRACLNSNQKVIKLLLEDDWLTPEHKHYPNLARFVRFDNIINFLLQDSRISPLVIRDTFRAAIRENAITTFKRLLEDSRCDPGESHTLATAIRNNRTVMFELLLKDPRVDPSVADNLALMLAVEEERPVILEMLLKDPRTDPCVDSNYLLETAYEKGHAKMVQILLRDRRVDPVVGNVRLSLVNDLVIEKFLDSTLDEGQPNSKDDESKSKAPYRFRRRSIEEDAKDEDVYEEIEEEEEEEEEDEEEDEEDENVEEEAEEDRPEDHQADNQETAAEDDTATQDNTPKITLEDIQVFSAVTPLPEPTSDVGETPEATKPGPPSIIFSFAQAATEENSPSSSFQFKSMSTFNIGTASVDLTAKRTPSNDRRMKKTVSNDRRIRTPGRK
ncbi:hypothetical protein HDU77_006169 [Chytriomyces hyalinus]|nr:hypothetical protein HDU77_006169 [Chytriomyces hyalinus]